MLIKILKLLGIGTLHEPLPNGALCLGKKTIIFGENGRGKSTLVAMLRSLSQGTGEALRGRATIGGTHPPSAEVLSSSRKHSYQQGGWDNAYESISIFDATFVAENVYAGSTVETDQRKNLLNFALGTTGVKLAQEVDRIAGEVAEAGRAEREATTVLQKHIVGATSPEAFAALAPPPDDIEAQLRQAELLLQAQKQASNLRDLQSFVPMNFDGPSSAMLEEALASSLASVSADAGVLLAQHRATTGVTEEWLMEGLKHCGKATCPFCQKSLEDSSLLLAYGECFSEAYRDHRSRLISMFQVLLGTVSEEIEEGLRRTVELNMSRGLAWRQFLSEVDLPFDLESARTVIAQGRTILDNLKSTKLGDPVQLVKVSDQQDSALMALSDLVVQCDDYNAKAVILNEKIAELRMAVQSLNIAGAQAKLDEILNCIARYKEPANKAVNSWRQSRQMRTALDQKKASARVALDRYSSGLPASLIRSVNKHLAGCGTYFKLTSLKQVYTGAKPRFEYVIEMRGRPVDLTGKAVDGVCFGTALSQGDKSALAFAFFLARLENDRTLSDHIVVFDDPLSSLDSCRRRYTRTKIAEIAPRVAQLILLSHEEFTVGEVAELLSERECTLLHIKESSAFSVIVPTSVKELTASRYVKYFDRMQRFLLGVGAAEDVVTDIRPYLEMNLKFRFTDHFGPDPLGKMIKQIRDAQEPSTLARMKPHLRLLSEINDYCTLHSHGDTALQNIEKILSSDLKRVIQQALEFSSGFPTEAIGPHDA